MGYSSPKVVITPLTNYKTMNYYIEVLKKYAVFTGRARRAEYWYFVLFNLIISLILAIIDNIIWGSQNGMMVLSGLYGLAVLIPSLAVAVRRLHDTGKSGWWILIALIPVIGASWLIILFIYDSNYGDNRFGPNPKGVTAAPSNPTPAV